MATTYEEYLRGQEASSQAKRDSIHDITTTQPQNDDDYAAYVAATTDQADKAKKDFGLEQQRGQPINLPSYKSQAWGGLPMNDTPETDRKLALWDSNRTIPLNEMTIPARAKDKFDRLKFAYGEDELRDWTQRAKAFDADIVEGKAQDRPISNLFKAFSGTHNTSHPLDKPEAPMKPRGTWNPVVHAGKDAMALISGMKQVVGDSDNEYSKKFQDSLDTYNQYDQPLPAQLAAAAAYMLPSMGASPLAIKGAEKGLGALAAGLGAKRVGADLSAAPLSKAIASRKAVRLPPGFGGLIEGGMTGALYHVDPNKKEPWKTRLSRSITSGLAGGALDAGVTAVGRVAANAAVNKARAEASKGLPETVRLPSGELWNRKSQAVTAKNYRDAGDEPSITWKQEAKEMFESGYGVAADDVSRNANIIRESITGSASPKAKGESLDGVLTRLQGSYGSDKDAAFDSVNKFIDSGNNVILDGKIIREVRNDLKSSISSQFAGMPTPAKIVQLSKTIKRMEKAMDKTGGFINAKKVLKLQRSLDTLIKGGDTVLESTANAAKRNLVSKLQEAEGAGRVMAGNQSAVSEFNKATNAVSDFYTKYKNPIIETAAQKSHTPREFSDALFGTKQIKDKAVRLDAINRLGTNPAREKALKSELTNRLLAGPNSKNFDMESFTTRYGDASDVGDANKMLDRLLPDARPQLDALLSVSDKLTNTYTKGNTSGLTTSSVPLQALAKERFSLNPLALPGIGKLGGNDFLRLLQARRYALGYENPMGTMRNTGKTAGLMSMDVWDPEERLKD